jgi:hypothetical protein
LNKGRIESVTSQVALGRLVAGRFISAQYRQSGFGAWNGRKSFGFTSATDDSLATLSSATPKWMERAGNPGVQRNVMPC